MLKKPLEIFEFFQCLDQFLEVFKPPRRFWRFVVLPHGGVAGFVQNDACKFGMLGVGSHAAPAVQITHKLAQF